MRTHRIIACVQYVRAYAGDKYRCQITERYALIHLFNECASVARELLRAFPYRTSLYGLPKTDVEFH
jgi:predicted nucleotidyltransferase